MEQFNNKTPPKRKTDNGMIILTKTNDITKIKGWHSKLFNLNSAMHQPAFGNNIKTEELKEGEKVSVDPLNKAEIENSGKIDLHETLTSDSKTCITPLSFSAEEELGEDKDGGCADSTSESENFGKKTRCKETKYGSNKNMSAFVSEELNKYLLNSSTLKISYLQEIYPYVIPIPCDAKILSISKLRKRMMPSDTVFKCKTDLNIQKIKCNCKSVQSSESYFNKGPIFLPKISEKANNVLVTNKTKKKGAEKNLPMDMNLSERKSRLRKLLDEAESMIPTKSGKRSIRLPTRFPNSSISLSSKQVSSQSYFDRPIFSPKICEQTDSVLVNNKKTNKEKSGKKLRTKEIYLPKKINMKISIKKSCVQELLEEAKSLIPTKSGKRSIRLPCRFADSAILISSKWVSLIGNRRQE